MRTSMGLTGLRLQDLAHGLVLQLVILTYPIGTRRALLSHTHIQAAFDNGTVVSVFSIANPLVELPTSFNDSEIALAMKSEASAR